MRPRPTCLRRLSLILYILFCLAPALTAAPARKGLLNLRQPDGTVVQAYLTGDENGHLVLTPDGCSLLKDAEGWWCYARYDYYGHRLNSGEHAGAPDTPGEVIAASRNIPYDLLRQRRAARIRRARPLRTKQLARTRTRTRAEEGGGVRRGLIILAQFEGLEFTYSRNDFEKLINGEGANSALSYFKDQWKDGYTFQFDITEPVTLPHDFAYYGANNDDDDEENAPKMILDACAAVGPEVDFSVYDNDGDGEVDNVFVFYAGPNEAEGAGDNYIWPHMWYVRSGAGLPPYYRDGVLVDNYACTSELTYDYRGSTSFTTLASIGTFCHEYTHTFGIPDLYDTDEEDSGGYAEAMWSCIDLMDAGNHNNDGKTPPNYSAVERWFFGMSEGKPLTEGVHKLRPVQENGDYYILETDHEDEIFLFECRLKDGWDAHIGGSGLLIYHIDLSQRPAGESTSAGKGVTAWTRWDINEVNARPDHQCVDLIEPDPDARKLYQDNRRNPDAVLALASHAFWPFEGISIYTCDTDPAFTFWSEASSPLGLADIRRNADGSVSFTVFNAQEDKAPAVKIDNQVVFQDATIIQWNSLDPSFTGNSIIRYGHANDAQLTEVEVPPYETGKYAFRIDGLKPLTPYTVQLLCKKGNIPGPVNSLASFLTNSDKKTDNYPYIYLKKIERGTDGSFAPDTPLALRVYNATDAVSVAWYFDGKPISPGADGYYHVTRSGVLKAVVNYPDSSEIITKKIVVK